MVNHYLHLQFYITNLNLAQFSHQASRILAAFASSASCEPRRDGGKLVLYDSDIIYIYIYRYRYRYRYRYIYIYINSLSKQTCHQQAFLLWGACTTSITTGSVVKKFTLGTAGFLGNHAMFAGQVDRKHSKCKAIQNVFDIGVIRCFWFIACTENMSKVQHGTHSPTCDG